MSNRNLPDWLNSYVRYASINSEPPMLYHWWVGISVLASALQRKCYVMEGFSRIFPNMYIVLVGPPGQTRKGTACNIGLDIVKQVDGIKFASNAGSRQGIIKKMLESFSNFENDTTGIIESHCSITIYNEELSVFLGQQDVELLAHLTNWYDARDDFEYGTISRGEEKIRGVCLNLLGATAPDWFSSSIPREALGGGFTSRVIFVVEEERAKIVTDTTPTIEQIEMREGLIADLQSIHTISGEYRMTEQARDAYDEWYTYQSNNPPFHSPHFQYYCSRRQTHLRKLMMVFSASRADDHRINLGDFERARNLLEQTEIKMPRAFTGLGKARYAEMMQKVSDYLLKHNRARISEILCTFFPDLDDYVLNIVLATLIKMNIVACIKEGADPTYEWRGRSIQ